MSEEKKRECIHARLDCVECAWIDGHSVAFWKAGGYVKLPQPAPEKPSADQGVTTESFDGFVWSRVLGKNVSNTLADLIRYRHRKDVDRATRGLREELTTAQGESEGWRKEAMRYQGESEKMREENARIKAEVERLTKERDESRAYADNLAMGLSHANTEAMTAKAANREQRRKGAEDAAAWLNSSYWRHVSSALRSAIDHGEVLRDGHATGGPLPASAFGCDVRDPPETMRTVDTRDPAVAVRPILEFNQHRVITTAKEGKLIIEIVIEKKGES